VGSFGAAHSERIEKRDARIEFDNAGISADALVGAIHRLGSEARLLSVDSPIPGSGPSRGGWV